MIHQSHCRFGQVPTLEESPRWAGIIRECKCEVKMTGIIRSMPEGKNFGFIQVGVKDYFFHKDNFNGNWKNLTHQFNRSKQISVEFEEEISAKGPRANNVTIMGEE